MTRRFIIVFALVAALLAGTVSTVLANDDCNGIIMYDGVCMTVDLYNETFSFENLSTVPSLAFPDLSVAEVYDIVNDGIEAADRPRTFQGVPQPTFRDYVFTLRWQIW